MITGKTALRYRGSRTVSVDCIARDTWKVPPTYLHMCLPLSRQVLNQARPLVKQGHLGQAQNLS